MTFDFARALFAALCVAGMVAIGAAAFFEFGRLKRGVSALTIRHFRWRMFSALLWELILGSLGYATIMLWPQNLKHPTAADKVVAGHFFTVVSGALLLLMLAITIMSIDFYFTLVAQRRASTSGLREAALIAREEYQKAEALKRAKEQN